jgi:hypothetical protein
LKFVFGDNFPDPSCLLLTPRRRVPRTTLPEAVAGERLPLSLAMSLMKELPFFTKAILVQMIQL